ncbi:MAG: tetratricopeptide repeat protein [Nitrospirae bacterium]|nr:tetratricopeptide repeat protein [Nitrospirota bacterium]
MAPALDAFALTAQEIYRRTEGNVLALELLDEKGGVVSFLTAVVLEQGTAVTQCDLLEGAAGLRLRSGDTLFPAKVEHRDSGRNLCMLSAPGAGSPRPQEVRDSDPEVGTQVYAVSNALGLGVGIAEGVVSGIRKSRGESFIQFTAAIAPGSEGGGLFDADGRLVGLINYRQRDGQNVNFALPARWTKDIKQRAASIDAEGAWRAKAVALNRELKWENLAEHAAAWTQALQDSTEAWLWLGFAQEQRKDWPAAEHAYREALQRGPSAIEAGIGLAKALAVQGKPKEGLDVARSMLAYRQEDARIWFTIGLVEAALSHPNEARQAFERAARLAPWNRDAHAALAGMARLGGDWSGAVAAQQQVVRIDSQNPVAWVELAQMYLLAGRAERALASADRAIDLAPTNGDAWIFKGGALRALKRHREAIDALKKGLALQPHRPALGWRWLGDIYYLDLRLFPEAIAAYREASRLEPGDASLRGSLAVALKDNYQFEEALALFEQLKTDNPNDPFPWRQVGFVHGYLAQAETAIPAYEQSLSLDPKQPKVWLALMEAYHTAGRQGDVKRVYRKLLALDPAWAERAYRSLILPYGVAP